MKKMTNNKKGFSLIELLIVVAILAILAAISINLFGGVLTKSKDKSDKAACSYLQTALQTYIAESDDSSLGGIPGGTTYANVVSKFSTGFTNSKDNVAYGPYLNNGAPKLSKTGSYFDAVVDQTTQVVTVTVSTTSGADTITIK